MSLKHTFSFLAFFEASLMACLGAFCFLLFFMYFDAIYATHVCYMLFCDFVGCISGRTCSSASSATR